MRTMLQRSLRASWLWMMALAVMVFAVGSAQAQTAVATVDFEADAIGTTYPGMGWNAADINAEVVDNPYGAASKVLRVRQGNYNAAPVLALTLPAGTTLSDVTSFTFDAYFAQGDVGWKSIVVEAYGSMPTHEFNREANRLGSYARNQGGSTAWETITIDITNTSELTGTVYFAFGFNGAGTGDIGGSGVQTTWYADNVTLVGTGGSTTEPQQVSRWAFDRDVTGDWDMVSSGSGSVSVSGGGFAPAGWMALRGHFDEIEPAEGETVVITGTLELTGGGLAVDGFNGSSSLRYGVFHRTGADGYAITSDQWPAGTAGGHYGYLFTAPSGITPDLVEWQGTRPAGGGDGSGDRGTVGVIVDRTWYSTNGGNDYVIDNQRQLPTYAAAGAGLYDFGFSFTRLAGGDTEVRYMLVNRDGSYYFVGSTTDDGVWADSLGGAHKAPRSYNTLAFALGLSPTATGMTLNDVTVQLGDPIELPETPLPTVPMTPVATWAFESGADGDGWEVTPGAPGDVSIGSDSGLFGPAGWAALRGRFPAIEMNAGQSVVLRGTMELVGGGLSIDGFNGASSLRYGLYYRSGADTLAITNGLWPSGTAGGHHGYLFMPPSGSEIETHPTWGNVVAGSAGWGSVGSVGGGTWYSTHAGNSYVLGQQMQQPPYATAGAGTYEFAKSFTRNEDGTTQVRFYFMNEDDSYFWAGSYLDEYAWADTLDNAYRAPNHFNTVAFAFGLSMTATEINLTDVMVGTSNQPITLPTFTAPEPPRPPHDVLAQLNVNGNFELSSLGPVGGGNTPFWSFNLVAGSAGAQSQGEAAVVMDATRGRVVRVDINEWNEMPDDWHIEAVNEPFYPEEGDFIQARVWLRADEAGRVARLYYGLPESGGWARYPAGGVGGGGITFELTEDWELYYLPAHTVRATDEANSMRFGISLNHEPNDGGVIYISDVRVRVEATEVSNEDELIHAFALDQNYPNPFNPVTTIAYEIASPNHVSLTIYNALGQRVATLVDGVQTNGRHQVHFNAQNLPSGVYFYQLRSEGNVVTKQMVLLK
jgi:hypothetical protein